MRRRSPSLPGGARPIFLADRRGRRPVSLEPPRFCRTCVNGADAARYASVCPDEPEFRVLVVHEKVVHRGGHKPPPLFSRKPYFAGFFGAPTAIGRESLPPCYF